MLMACVWQLKPDEQKFIECEWKGMRHSEIAIECGCGPSEIGIRLKRIHKKLSKILTKFVQKEEG